MLPNLDALRKEFGHLSRAEILYRIEKNDGIDASQARTWLEHRADEEREDAIARANASLEAARTAARSSSTSARFAMWAAIIALFGIVAQVALGLYRLLR